MNLRPVASNSTVESVGGQTPARGTAATKVGPIILPEVKVTGADWVSKESNPVTEPLIKQPLKELPIRNVKVKGPKRNLEALILQLIGQGLVELKPFLY